MQISLPPTNILTFYLKLASIFLISTTTSTLLELCTLSLRISMTFFVLRWSVSIYLTSIRRAFFLRLHLLISFSSSAFIHWSYFLVLVFLFIWDIKFYIFSIAPATKNSMTSISGRKCAWITLEWKVLS